MIRLMLLEMQVVCQTTRVEFNNICEVQYLVREILCLMVIIYYGLSF
jgi:hypothetical protein